MRIAREARLTLRVLEFGDRVAAGYCGKLFARWGAEVIRVDGIDAPKTPMATVLDGYMHRGKRRVGLDRSSATGRTLLDRLAQESDILICDGSAPELEALGWQKLGSACATKVRTAITPFGFSGPYRDWQASGPVLLAMGGYTWLMGDPGRACGSEGDVGFEQFTLS